MSRTLRKKQEPTGSYQRLIRTTCGNCPTGCGLKVFYDQSGMIDIFGDEEHPVNKGSICPKGMLALRHLDNPNRLKAPRIREKISDPFAEVSWPQALDFITSKLDRCVQQKGRQSVHVTGRDIDPFAYTAGGSWFAAHYGAGSIPAQFYPPSLGSSGVVQSMFGVAGRRMLMNSPRDWAASHCILVFRSDLAASDPISLGPLLDARDRGRCLLAIDCKRTMTTHRAQQALVVKPGTEALALKGLIHLLLKENLVDEEFLSEWTEGVAPLASLVSPCEPAGVAARCGVRLDDFLRVADLVRQNHRPLQVVAGDWATRPSLTEEELFLCGSMVAITGSVGIPGGGLNLLCVSPFDWPEMINQHSGGSPRLNDYRSSLCLPKLLLEDDSPCEALFCYGNLFPRLGGGKLVEEAWDRIGLIVHMGAYPSATHHRAHVSLPMSSWLEYEGLLDISNGRAVQWHHQVSDPPGQCRSPLEFWTDLAHHCGLNEWFPWRHAHGRVDHGKAADFFLKRCPLLPMVSVQDLDPASNPPGGLLWPCTETKNLDFEESHFIKGNVRGDNILFQRWRSFPGSDQRFPTPSGRINFAALPPALPKAEPALPGYPLTLIVRPLVDYVPEYGFFVSNRRPGSPAPQIKLHPQIGRLLAIKQGDPVVVVNDLGAMQGAAWLSDEVPPDVVCCPEGVDPYQPHFEAQGPYALFNLSPGGSCLETCARVTLYPQGGNLQQSQLLLEDFLAQLGSTPPLRGEEVA